MPTKLTPKDKAIVLRKHGYSYGSISRSIGVPKSTLSGWLKNLKLSNRQMNKLKIITKSAYLLGGKASRAKRLLISKEIRNDAIKWITEIIGIDINNLVIRVYINEAKKLKSKEYLKIWSKIINIPHGKIKIFFTKDRHSNLKRSSRNDYKGQLRIVVNKSTNLNRRIAGLVEGICLQSGIK